MSHGSSKHRAALLLAGVLALPPIAGCSIAVLVTRTIINEPLLIVDSIYLKAKMDRMAKHAWQEFKQENATLTFSHSFRHGFLDGFSSFLDGGGNCVPPAAPPRSYWKYSNLNAAGFQKTKDYMEGYQEGSLRAKGSNLRDSLLVPILIGDDDLNRASSSLKPNYPSPLNNRTAPNRVAAPPSVDPPIGDASREQPSPFPEPIPGPAPVPGTPPVPPAQGSAPSPTLNLMGSNRTATLLPLRTASMSSTNGGGK